MSSSPHAAHPTGTVRYSRAALEVRVDDDGRGPTRSSNGAGHGLIGMRERIALYGSTLETGTRGIGGFRVAARLALGPAGSS
jgi:signal transduction histidine kinase